MYNVKLVTKQSWWFLSSNGVSKRGRSILLGYFRSCMGSRIEMTLWKLNTRDFYSSVLTKSPKRYQLGV